MHNLKKIAAVFYPIIVSLCLTIGSAAAQVQSVTRENLEAALRQTIVANGPWKTENVELRIAPFQPVSMAAGAVSYRILRPVKGITPGFHNFLVAADIGGKEAARFWVKVDVRIFDDVVVTSHALAHHETVSSTHVRLERRDISSLSGRPFGRVGDVEGQQTTRAIEVNEVLTQKMLDRAILMRRGAQVKLVYETGGLRVEAPGIAHEPGKLGDVIQVKNPASGKLLRGAVIDAHSVRVH